LDKSFRELFSIGLKEKRNHLELELKEENEYIYLLFKGFDSLIADFSKLENAPLFQFDDPLTGDSEVKYLDLPLIRLILNQHNVKISIREDENFFSLRFKKVTK
jgi:hypothetical protein